MGEIISSDYTITLGDFFVKLFHKKGILTPLIFKEIFDKILEIKADTNPMEWQLHIDKTIEENIKEIN